jgi:hypothetical protein
MIKNNYTLLDDTPSIKPNDLEFKEHRHDQSLLSVLLKTTRPDAVVLPHDETWEIFNGNFDSAEALKYPIWAKRRKLV